MAAMATDAPAGGAPVVTRLLCVRHGETHWNEQGWLQGHQETSLNELGRRQATAAGKYLATHHRGAVAIISSDLGRTRETAELIGAELGLPVQLTPLLRETHLGAFQGLTWEEAKAQYAPVLDEWRAHPDFRPPGGGESLEMRLARVAIIMNVIAAAFPGQEVVVVSHGGTLEDVARIALQKPFGEGTGLRKANAAINIVEHVGRFPFGSRHHSTAPVATAAAADASDSDGDTAADGAVAAAVTSTPPKRSGSPLAPTPFDSLEWCSPRTRELLEPAHLIALRGSRPTGIVPPARPSTRDFLVEKSVSKGVVKALHAAGRCCPVAAGTLFGVWRIAQWGITEHLHHAVVGDLTKTAAATHVAEGDIMPATPRSVGAEVVVPPSPTVDGAPAGAASGGAAATAADAAAALPTVDVKALIATAAPLAVPFAASEFVATSGVSAAILTSSGNIYTGICIDVGSSLGFCAEHAAMAEMLKRRETHIRACVAVLWDGSVIPPCGRCREFLWQVDPRNADTQVILGPDKAVPLSELLPHPAYVHKATRA